MFTGLVEETGTIIAVDPTADGGARLTIGAGRVLSDAADGDSIAVNGVCLTVTALAGGSFGADVMPETLRRSTLGGLAEGDRVNLERAARAGSRLGGHIVQGHVDGVGEVSAVVDEGRWTTITITVPSALSRYLAEKGSITVDGVSLTISGVSGPRTGAPAGAAAAAGSAAPGANGFGSEGSAAGDWFQVSLIPTTLAETTLGRLVPGSAVNLEVDVIAKYVERLLAAGQS